MIDMRTNYKVWSLLDSIGIKLDNISHKYTIDGRNIPSATQIIDTVYGNPFSLSTIYMRRAREKGTLIHNSISEFLLSNREPSFPMREFDNFLKLSNKHNLIWDISEQIIYCKVGGIEYAGTLDLYSSRSKEISDIKTGSTKAIEKWTIQLSLYAWALRLFFGIKVKKASVLWLHNEKAEYIPIKLLNKKQLLNFIELYKNKKEK